MSIFFNRNKFNYVPTNIVSNQDNRLIDSDCVIFDIETTGLDYKNDRIIQFAGLKISNDQIVDTIDFFINPKIKIPGFITDINRIRDVDVENAISISEGLKKIVEFFDNNFLIAHNGINFDMNFINDKLLKNNMSLISNPLLDTMWLSKAINPDFTKHSLAKIVESYKINYDTNKAHQALYDSELLFNVWLNLKHKLKKLKINRLDEINKKFVSISLIDTSKVHN